MKKTIYVMILLGGMGLFVSSCGDGNKAKEAEKQELSKEAEHGDHGSDATPHEHSGDMAAAVYQCPMKCEAEKTYPEHGSCPVCKMDLKEVESSEEEE